MNRLLLKTIQNPYFVLVSAVFNECLIKESSSKKLVIAFILIINSKQRKAGPLRWVFVYFFGVQDS